ncbi:MAG: site-specific integrase [Limnochordia bacterium]|nr:site-specific integrase [Limnochordia bacterium]
MDSRLTIQELSATVLSELENLNYSRNTICGFGASFKKITAYAEELGVKYFTEEFGRQYLAVKHDCTVDYYEEPFPPRAKHAIRCIRLLGDYQLHGVIIRRIVKKKNYVKPPQFQGVLAAYEKECANNEYSVRGMRTRLQRLFFFIDYIGLRNIQDVNDITPEIISDYVKTIFPYHEKSISSILSTLRVFLKFLYLNRYTDIDLSVAVPKQNRYYYPPVPSTWNPEDVKRMLDNIDRGNPVGKRDYAILLMVAKLGIRVGDLKSLKLTDLDWRSRQISICQQKTGVQVTYPILDDVGWALIEYLRYGRPSACSSPYLFVRLNAPYEAFGENANLHNIITKYTRAAGIKVPHKSRHGLHSLRHTLASTLLEQETPLAVISEILGHVNARSTTIYLRTDMEGLRRCALDPEEVMTLG